MLTPGASGDSPSAAASPGLPVLAASLVTTHAHWITRRLRDTVPKP